MKCPKCGMITEVKETRGHHDGVVNKRRRECRWCGNKFNTYEIDDGLEKTLKKYLAAHIKAVQKQQALTLRNEKIIARLEAGEKHMVVAADFGLSDNMISTIARRAGIPAYQKMRRKEEPSAAPRTRKKKAVETSKKVTPASPYKTVWRHPSA